MILILIYLFKKKKKAYIVKFVIVKISLFFFVTPEAKPHCWVKRNNYSPSKKKEKKSIFFFHFDCGLEVQGRMEDTVSI